MFNIGGMKFQQLEVYLTCVGLFFFFSFLWYTLYEGWTFLSALFFVLQSITTVGFGKWCFVLVVKEEEIMQTPYLLIKILTSLRHA